MKQLTVDWQELMAAFDGPPMEASYYLDIETGEVLLIPDEAQRRLEELYEEHFDPDEPGTFVFEDLLAEMSTLHDWQKEQLRQAQFVEDHFGQRMIALPHIPSYEAYNDMQDFIGTIQDDHLYHQLAEATHGRGAFPRFRDILAHHRAQEDRWYAFQDNRVRERVLEWLAECEIQPLAIPEPEAIDQAEEDTPRHRLLEEVLIFVRAASRLGGVTRIALIGSLTTEKPDPKDADLLVTVTDDADLAPVATLGRKLQGHAQSFGRGGDVFLADSQHRYLGRTCPWKRCGPGIRVSCDALHCGRRRFLHDDLEAVELPATLVARPQLELWPEILARVAVPDDVAQVVLQPLRQWSNQQRETI